GLVSAVVRPPGFSRPRSAHRRRLAVLLAATAVLALPAGAGARDIFVDTTADGIANDANCTLREAIRAANTNKAVDRCAAGQAAPAIDVVVLAEAAEPYRLTVAGPDDATGDLDIYSPLDITGAPSIIDASGLGDRVLD